MTHYRIDFNDDETEYTLTPCSDAEAKQACRLRLHGPAYAPNLDIAMELAEDLMVERAERYIGTLKTYLVKKYHAVGYGTIYSLEGRVYVMPATIKRDELYIKMYNMREAVEYVGRRNCAVADGKQGVA